MEENATLAELRDTLLPKLISGEPRPNQVQLPTAVDLIAVTRPHLLCVRSRPVGSEPGPDLGGECWTGFRHPPRAIHRGSAAAP